MNAKSLRAFPPIHGLLGGLFLTFCVGAGIASAQYIPALRPTHANVVYGEAGGQKQLLDLYYPNMLHPAAGKTFPLVLCVHGGAWREGSKSDMGVLVAALTKTGFAVATPSYRLFHPEKHPDNIYPTQIDDIQRSVRWLRANAAKYGLDPERFGAVGFSAGGHLVSLLGTIETRDNSDAALARYSSRVRCVVDVFGPADLTRDYSHLKLGNGTVQDLVDDFLGRGKPATMVATLRREASPIFHVTKRSGPFLILHGDKDVIVPVENSRDLHKALQSVGAESKYVELKGAGHGFDNLGVITRALDETMTFLKAELMGDGK
jgi:acetyl esterase/lipase